MIRQRLLVVEDDSEMRNVIALALRAYGYDVSQVGTGADALTEVRTRTPDAVILDIGLPDIDGFVVTACIRQDYELPIIVLSARGEEQHQVRALDNGANDYVVKPFREGELMARVRAALRRPVPLVERRDLTIGDLRFESMQRQVYLRGAELRLTKTEYALLHALARSVDRVVTHGQLLAAVWGPERVNEVQYLRVFIRALREKLEDDPTQPRRIMTVLGVGYRLASLSQLGPVQEQPVRALVGELPEAQRVASCREFAVASGGRVAAFPLYRLSPTRTLTINDCEIHCELRGRGEPLLLLHGFTGCSGDWQYAGRDELGRIRAHTLVVQGRRKPSFGSRCATPKAVPTRDCLVTINLLDQHAPVLDRLLLPARA